MVVKCDTIAGGKNNILLVGLIYDSNLGDQAIYECSLNIVESILATKNSVIEIRKLDLYGRKKARYSVSKVELFTGRVKAHLGFGSGGQKIICNSVKQQFNKIVDENTCCIIFVGGGLIKFSHQVISEPMCIILEEANKRDIPVMLSAVGVEGFDCNSEECIRLRDALNFQAVKVITTRDDIVTLRNNYILNQNIYTARVADPACSISTLYCPPKTNSKNRIGLGVGRNGLFEEYCDGTTTKDIREFWKKLYRKFNQMGYECVFFTNGLEADYDEACEIISDLRIDKKYLAPRPSTVEQLINMITSFQGAVVTRLHSSILAYSYSIPTVGLVWNNKQHMFGEVIGFPNRYVDPPFDIEMIFETLVSAIDTENNDIDSDYCSSTKREIARFLDSII